MTNEYAPITGLPQCDVCGLVRKDGRHPDCKNFADTRAALREQFATVLTARNDDPERILDAYDCTRSVREMIDLLGRLVDDRSAWRDHGALTMLRIQRYSFCNLDPENPLWVHPPAKSEAELP